jgi:aspartyl-tRNA(Asn)/glutamyl-tRNA(Gln) amidotransferase subunit C
MIEPMAGLSRSEVEHVAFLARLGLTAQELERLEGELNHILDQYSILARLDTASIAPTAQVIELDTILRPDVVEPSLPVSSALANAARTEGEFVAVPPVLTSDGG